MIAILDVAPVVHGFTADIGYTFCVDDTPTELSQAFAALREVRALIPPHVARGDTMRSIYLRVGRLLRQRGYDECHRRYPFRALGHRVTRLAPRVRELSVGGFGLSSALGVLGTELVSRLPAAEKLSPLFRDAARVEHRLEPGVWAIEPHLAASTFGAKFEELLVVEDRRAYWLDDALPHVNPLRDHLNQETGS
jgi:hypothetical protein